MDKFATLEPVKLYTSASTAASRWGRGSGATTKAAPLVHLIGRLPADLHVLVLTYLSITDIPAFGRCSRALAEFARDERVWEAKWAWLGVDAYKLGTVLDELEEKSKVKPQATATVNGSDIGQGTLGVDDDFGEFASGAAQANVIATGSNLFSLSQGVSLSLHPSVLSSTPSKPTFRSKFIRAHSLLKPLLTNLSSAPHLVLTSLFPLPNPPTLPQQSRTLHLLARYLSPSISPVRAHTALHASLRSAIDRFQANLLSAFDAADVEGQRDEKTMREVAHASWEVWEGRGGLGSRGVPLPASEWELGKVWAEKKEIFYEQGQWRPLDNFTKDGALDFDAMDAFMSHVIDVVSYNGEVAVRVFPLDSLAVLSFADRVAVEVIGEYITPLLTKARAVSDEVFLKATAATFRESWRLVDVLVGLNRKDVPNGSRPQEANRGEKRTQYITLTQAEDVVFQMFEPNMDEYLDEEVEWVKHALEVINREWQRKIASTTGVANPSTPTAPARFLGSQNPQQLKRNVLASFTDVLLLPVTIVPRTVGAVGAALVTGGGAAVQGISMLNPQRWVSQGVGGGNGYSRNFDKGDGEMVFEVGGDDDEDENEKRGNKNGDVESLASRTTLDIPPPSTAGTDSSFRSGTGSSTPSSLSLRVQNSNGPSNAFPRASPNTSTTSFDHLELLLSLDTALELIHADREALKRVETFAAYPGRCGHRVRDTIEEVFILLLRAVGEGHIYPGFEKATEQMRTYKPAEHEETTSVAPLMQFFELVHLGDTIQSMVQVYFDKELAPHIDKTDFLNAVVREKKRFENVLDDSVAAAMNAGTEVLMNQVEHIILTRTQAREYYPPEDAPLDLGPTKGCSEAIACLDMHCKLLKGSTSKEVLEVFHQEVGIRLLAILHRHIKRQIISLSGGFQVIADLNAYHAFISTLKVPTVAADFSNLKMLGHVYVVEDAKDLAQIVRDVTRYGGAYRPEDIYEFIQRRADWKKIEKTVDKAMYNLSFKEDCIIC